MYSARIETDAGKIVRFGYEFGNVFDISPLSGVDVEGMETLMEMLDEIRREYDLSILMTTHDFSMLPRYADQVVLIDHGVKIQGNPETVLNSSQFRQAFHLKGGSL